MTSPRMLRPIEISTYMGISLRQANYMMTMFKNLHMTVSNGNRNLIDARRFAEYLSEQDGMNVDERVKDLREVIRECRK